MRFRKGYLVKSGRTVVLVTGQSKLKEYHAFCGVVIDAKEDSDGEIDYQVGTYSEMWSLDAFKKYNAKIKVLPTTPTNKTEL